MKDKIIIRGARQHNLKNINIEIPKNKLVVFTGISGSGKSSLAFDTIYAEGQRRYVESLSSYARQFLGIMDKPDVETIEGLSPSISIDQKTTSHNPRSTIGTVTEIYDYVRLLFSRIGHPHCPSCGSEIAKLSVPQITDLVEDLIDKLIRKSFKIVKLMILSPVIRDRKGEFQDLFANLKSKGFTLIRIDGHIFSLNEDLVLIKTNKHSIDVVIDRLIIDKKILSHQSKKNDFRRRIFDSIEQATGLSEGLAIISEISDASFDFPDKPKKFTDHLYSQRFACAKCNISLPEIEPRIFSFNSPHGACQKCSGIGSLLRVDPNLILNLNLSIYEGAIFPFAGLILSDTWYGRTVLSAVKKIGIDPEKPLKEFSKDKIHKLLYGTGDEIYDVSGENRHGRIVTIHEIFTGIIPELEKRYHETDSEIVRTKIAKFLTEEICPRCQGKRLKDEALSITVDQKNIVDIVNLPVNCALTWIDQLNSKLDTRGKTIADMIIKEIHNRLSFLISVGLDYLCLERSASSLSGGEAQRIRLASQIGSSLTGVLYVLDEPSIGLHQRDNCKLIQTLKKLRDLGNTVIVVEHDREIMESADFLIDFGPGAGKHGGKIISYGTIEDIKRDNNSLTGKYLSGKKEIKIIGKHSSISPNYSNISVSGCSEHNLKKINAVFPLGKLICVTGVSGSGKSTLVVDTLYKALARHFNPFYREKAGQFDNITGLENIQRVILIDQSPIGRTPRSNPATYTGSFTYIRELFSQTPQARACGFAIGRFSFNVRGGRCEICEGEGNTKIEMQFLPDVYVKCEVCRGTRYNFDTLEVKFKGKNIAEILEMTVEEALRFFENIPGLYTKLETLNDVGLSYIQLGQSATELSGGEAQRVKLATELSKKGSKKTVYILDEPTTGLHFADLEKLLQVLHKLVDLGNTVIVIEHNLDIIKNADWVIDLGLEGGDEGGSIIAYGTPVEMSQNPTSYTGQYLKKIR